MGEFGPESRVHDVMGIGPLGRHLLWQHGYDAGEGFIDVLSQYQTLDEAERAGRLRDLAGLIADLRSQTEKGRVPEPLKAPTEK